MEKELTKKEISKIIGETTKALNDKDKSVLVLTSNMAAGKGNLVEILALVAKTLKRISDADLTGKLAVDALIESLKETKKKEKALEDMSEDELLEELKKTMESIKKVLS